MIANNDRNYDQQESNITNENQSYIDQYQQEHSIGENNLEEELLLNEDQSYLDSEFSNALERDDEEDDQDEQDLEEDDLDEDEEDLDEDDLDDDLTEDYDENDREPETFSDDGYKID
ncbi:hypothetical protein [Flavobacterium sp. N1736]|uniref:hypothetical protein n=1 Tax=Flavobacterium sp. N1736 TaxID=2986823 RepID=UPI0022259F89|nr:hypothetical protein [Flavobacterium sp. N1736]